MSPIKSNLKSDPRIRPKPKVIVASNGLGDWNSRKEAYPLGQINHAHATRRIPALFFQMLAEFLGPLREGFLVVLQRVRGKGLIPSSPELSVDFEVANIDDGVIFSVFAQLTVPSRVPDCKARKDKKLS